jgi:CRISPR-associated protein Cmr4
VRIDAGTGTVAKGALWTEEALPIESVLWGLLQTELPRNKVASKYSSPDAVAKAVLPEAEELTLQIGGNASVGQGRVRMISCYKEEE